MAENYYWKAVYKDGVELCQYNGDGSENKYTDIDRTRLVRFALLQVHNDFPVLTVHFDRPGQRLVCRRRKAIRFGAVGGSTGIKPRETVWIVGWQETIEGRSVQSINFVFENGSVESRPGFVENSQWAYPLKTMLPCEQD